MATFYRKTAKIPPRRQKFGVLAEFSDFAISSLKIE
jgi:hypothetical protein